MPDEPKPRLRAASFGRILRLARPEVGSLALGTAALLVGSGASLLFPRVSGDLIARLMDQEIAFFDEKKTGELTNRPASDTTVLQNAVSVNISMGLRFVANIAGGVGLLLYTSP